MRRTEHELREMLYVQTRMLNEGCMIYDRGDTWGALSIAVAAYILVHDHGDNRSILEQLGIKDKVIYGSSVPPNDPQLIERVNMYTPLIAKHQGRFYPVVRVGELRGLDTMPVRYLPFDEWWTNEIIFKNETAKLTRRQLTLSLRNQEGGGHFDELRNPNYIASRINVLHISRDPEVTTLEGGLDLAMMRQIGWELAKGLEILNGQTP